MHRSKTSLKTTLGYKLLLCALATAPVALGLRAQEQPAAPAPAATAPAPTADKPASADDASGEVVKMEAFGVTGSNIKRMDSEKVLPVTVFNKDAMDVRMALTPVDMLTALPQVTNVPRNESTNGGAGSRGDNANINLRGVGADNTLVLLNGRRLAPHPITSGDNGFLGFSVNVNQLPTQGIERVDILRDGASSIYGSDAVAGVINYITRRDFRGTELKLRFSVPEHPGGSSMQATLTYGTDFANGKGRFLTTLDTLYRDGIYLRDRDFSSTANHTSQVAAPFNTSSSFNGTAVTGFYPSFKVGSTAGTTTYFRPLTAGATPVFTTTAPASAANARDPYYYIDINKYQMGSPRSRRANWFSSVEYDLTDKITAFADISYYYAYSTLVRQPLAVNSPGADAYVTLGVDNPYNPYGSRFYSTTGAANTDGSARLTGTPQATVLLTGVIQGQQPEHVDVYSSVYRIVSGLRGKIGGTWTWESAGLYTRAYATDMSRNGVRESLLQAAALRTDASAYNPFGYTFKVSNGAIVIDQPYTNPASVQKSYQGQFRHEGFSSIGSWDLRTSGEVFDLWSGASSAAAGVEARKEEFVDKRAEFSGLNPVSSGLDPNNNDYITASPKPDSAGQRIVLSAYAESVTPLVAPKNHIPGVYSLELTGSARFEHYDDFGNTTRPKVGLNYKPIDGIMIRASFNEGFTAPNLPTLYAPSQYTVDSLPGTTDLYRANGTPTGNSTYVMRNYTTGNPNLKPVTSIGKSIGAVVDIPGVKGLSVTADYWQLEQSNVIGSLTSTQLLTSDANLLNAYVASQVAAGVPVGSIDLGSGTANYKGDPAIVRLPVTADDIADFAGTGKAVAGKILSRSVAYLNLAKGYVSGWDLSANYNLPVNSLGRFSFNTDWTYLIRSYQLRNSPTGPVFIERNGQDGTTRWRGSATTSWRKGNWNASLSAYYTGTWADTSASTTAATYSALGSPSYISKVYDNNTYNYRLKVGDIVTFNTVVGYRFQDTNSPWLRGMSVKVGVINLADKVPPVSSGNFGYNAGVYGGLLAGRTWTLELTKQF